MWEQSKVHFSYFGLFSHLLIGYAYKLRQRRKETETKNVLRKNISFEENITGFKDAHILRNSAVGVKGPSPKNFASFTTFLCIKSLTWPASLSLTVILAPKRWRFYMKSPPETKMPFSNKAIFFFSVIYLCFWSLWHSLWQ